MGCRIKLPVVVRVSRGWSTLVNEILDSAGVDVDLRGSGGGDGGGRVVKRHGDGVTEQWSWEELFCV